MRPSSHPTDDEPARPRLQKVLATAGLGSRRKCEELILSGRVEIDRQRVTELGTRVDPKQQEVRVDGVVLRLPRRKYFMLHKPVGVVCTARDPWARTRVLDLVEDPDRLFTVGRLDKSSSGLILVTNDGELANRLAHPRYRVQKTYRVTVAGKPTLQALQQLRQGVHLAEGRMRVERVQLKQTGPRRSVLEVILAEGRNREIRRVLARVGHKVQQLKRIGIGRLRLGDLPVGAYRELSREEVRDLRQLASPKAPGGSRPTRRATGRKSRPGGRPPAASGGRSGRPAGGKSARRGRRPNAAAPHRPGREKKGRAGPQDSR